jgi:hypothetical protein
MAENENSDRLGGPDDPRRAYRVEETPPEIAAILFPALDRLIDELTAIIARGQSSIP